MNTLHFVLLNLTQHSRFFFAKMFLARWNGDVEYQFQASEAVRFSEAGRWITTAPPQGAQTGLVPAPSIPADPWLAGWLADCLFDSLAYLPGGPVIKLAVWFACRLIRSLTDSAAARATAGSSADWPVKHNRVSLPHSATVHLWTRANAITRTGV